MLFRSILARIDTAAVAKPVTPPKTNLVVLNQPCQPPKGYLLEIVLSNICLSGTGSQALENFSNFVGVNGRARSFRTDNAPRLSCYQHIRVPTPPVYFGLRLWCAQIKKGFSLHRSCHPDSFKSKSVVRPPGFKTISNCQLAAHARLRLLSYAFRPSI